MQRLEVSGAVPPLQGSLGVKGLMNRGVERILWEAVGVKWGTILAMTWRNRGEHSVQSG